MANEQYPVIVYSSGTPVSGGASSYAAVLETGGNDMIVALSGGVVAETSMGAGTLLVAESGAVVSGINIDADGAVLSGTEIICSGAEKWYGPAACATFGSVVLVGGEFTKNSAFASGGYLGQGGALEGYWGDISVTGGVYTLNMATGGGGAILAIGGATEITGATFTDNSATYGGAVEISQDGGTAVVSGAAFTGNKADFGGAVEIHQGASALIAGASFTGNSATSGGAVMVDAYALEKSYLTLVSATFTDNAAEQGGAILNDGVLTVSGGTFAENEAEEGKGGALYNTGSATVTGAAFEDNYAVYGGAVWQGKKTLELNGNTFSNNTAIYGGALYANTSGSTLISGAVFTSNAAPYDEDYDLGGMGGALYVAGGATVTVTDTEFTGNVAEVNPESEWDGGCGGAVINYGEMTVTGGEFTANRAYYGAGLYNQASWPAAGEADGTLTVVGADFADNTASWGGGAICNCYGTLTVTGGEYTGNKVTGKNGLNVGGGAIANWSDATITGATFTNNTVTVGKGGAVTNTGTTLTVTDAVFSDNSANQGGAIWNMDEYGGSPVARLVNCTFTGNTAEQGGALLNGGVLTVSGGTFAENEAEEGKGGALYNTGSAVVSGATFTGNEALYGGAIWQGVGTLALDGAKVEDNTALYGGALYAAGSGATVVSGGSFSGNSTPYDEDYELGGMGGAVYVTNAATVTIADAVFENNFAEVNPDNEWDGGCGGAVINYGSFTISGGSFIGNGAYYGGGLYNQAGSVAPMTVENTDFTGNAAEYGGGAICNCWGELVVSGGEFSGNVVAIRDGGAIANWSEAEISGASFTANTAVKGGALSHTGTTITVTGATFTENSADEGGAFWNMNEWGDSVAALVDCTFTDNTATVAGGAIWNGETLTLDGCNFTTASDTIYNAGAITVTGATTTFAAEVTNTETGVITVELADAAALIDGWSFITGGKVGISVAAGKTETTYGVATGVETWSGNIGLTVGGADTGAAFTLENGAVTSGAFIYNGIEYALAVDAGAMTLTTTVKPVPTDLVGDENGVSWTGMAGDPGYVLELSQDDFATAIAVKVAGTAVDFLTLEGGGYSWRVRGEGYSDWAPGKDIVSPERTDAPKVVAADGDGVSDIFFANATGTWQRGYLAKNVGSTDGWQGTGEYADLTGKNRFEDIFKGAADANVMYLTDADNGDAIFLDDIYSYGGNTQARMEKIGEIRTGVGNDVVDLTSQRYAWNGGRIVLRGGDGDDTLWGVAGGCRLFGDAGNDKLAGGSGDDLLVGGTGDDTLRGCGGDDVFAFGGAWGADTVVQEAAGSVTLWFASGDEAKWDAGTLTYTDGDNRVTVSGVTADKVTLKFGDDGSEQYTDLVALGAFMEQTTAGIFDVDDPTKRVLASL